MATDSTHKHSGLVTLEFAVLIPAYLILVFGIVQLCIYFYVQQALTIVAFQSGRYVAIHQLESCAQSNSFIKDKVVRPYLLGYAIDPTHVTVNVNYNNASKCNCPGEPIVVQIEASSQLLGIDEFKPFAISVFRKEGVMTSECTA